MRPLLHPALSCVWRGNDTLQIGLTPGRAFVVGGLGRAEHAVLRAMDGQNDLATLRAFATTEGGQPGVADRLVDLLVRAGAATDQDEWDAAPEPPDRHEPDRASLGLVDRGRDGGRSTFARRGDMYVEVVGAGRVGASVARLLEAGGVGDVDVDDQLLVRPQDISPAGHPPDAVGLTRDRSLQRALHEVSGARASGRSSPCFVVLAPTAGLEHTQLADSLLRAGVPHLFVQVTEVTGVVGPLVVPGSSACLRCLDLHRTDRDRDWPSLRDQTARKPPASPACDASLATTIAGLATGHVLAYLDGFQVASIDGTIELELPYGLPRRRSWRPHPDCGCTWSEAAE